MKVPIISSTTPTASTRPAPYLSASAPAKGCVRPHHNCPKAKARLMLPRPRPVDVFIDERNSPMLWRVPIVSAKVPAAASSTSQNATRRTLFASVMQLSFGDVRQQVLALVQQL